MVSNVHVAQTVLKKRHSGISSDSVRNLVCSVGLETTRLIFLQTRLQGIRMVTQPISRRYRTDSMSTKIKWICALVCYLYMLYLWRWNPCGRIPATKGILVGILWEECIQIRKQTNVPILYRMISFFEGSLNQIAISWCIRSSNKNCFNFESPYVIW